MGTVVRHPSLRTRAGSLAARALPAASTALAVAAVRKVRLGWLECSRSDEAQQLSAWACVRTRTDPDLCESPLCIGHSPPSAQQAMRSCGVDSQPAHTAVFPARSPTATRITDKRLMRICTDLRMLEPGPSVNEGPARADEGVAVLRLLRPVTAYFDAVVLAGPSRTSVAVIVVFPS
jgi:hypothetical protein